MHFRTHARLPVNFQASLLFVGRSHRARVLNLGLGGTALECSIALTENTNVELEVHTPSRWDPLVLQARVVWSKGVRGGLAFNYRNEAEVWAVYELLAAQAFE